MPGDALPSLEEMVIAEIDAVFEPMASLLSGRPPEEPSSAESKAIFEAWGTIVQSQGMILARISLMPWTRSELKSDMSGIVGRAPAWLDAHYRGERAMTLELFAHGIAQTMATQRAAFEQVLAEQVSEPALLQRLLAGAPIPTDPEEMPRSALLAALANAMTAHTEALVGIAADFDKKVRHHFGDLPLGR